MAIQPIASLGRLADRMGGELITPGHPLYDSARRVWNGMIDRRPAAIARCIDADDVATAIRFAREAGLPLAVRGGGHNTAGTAVIDDGLVIDLSLMRAVRLDDSRRSVHVQGGATWGEVDAVTQPLGLATPGGVVSETGVAGLALSGGVSSQRRAHGMTIDNIVSAEVVLADSRRVRASADEHVDVYWAIRGGGNFGIVTSFELRLHELGPDVFALNVAYPLECAIDVIAAWRNLVSCAPDELSTHALLWTLPVTPEPPEHLRGRPFVGVGGMYAGAVEDGERLTQPLRELATPLLDMSGTVPYLALQQSYDPYFPAGLRYYWKALYLDGLSDAAIDRTVAWSAGRPSPRTLAVIRHCGGALSRVDAGATAFGDRGSEWLLSIDSTWDDPADDQRNVCWTRAFWDDAHRYSDGKTSVRASYGANYARLARIKAEYDPENVLRRNQNIPPAA
jgi:FAD/FMN-containing dehydrogenase